MASIFLNDKRKLRDLWWVGVFFLVLAGLTFPVILASHYYKFGISISIQAVIVITASVICQLLRRKPLSELFGAFDLSWFKKLFLGILIGAALMAVPAFALYILGGVSFQVQAVDLSFILSATTLFIAVAIAEEVLFHGFIFQRLIASTGQWPAQLIIAAYFLLIHLNNPGMTGSIKMIAAVNIFLASILFGLAFIRSKSLAMPIGIHFMANWVQGTLLGFGVSGNEQAGLLKPVFYDKPVWLTGGSFGLEASIPGLITVILTILLLYRWTALGNQVAPGVKNKHKKNTEVHPVFFL